MSYASNHDLRSEQEHALELVDRVVQARCGGRVERCHGIPHQSSYNNAAHSWGVAMLLHALFPGQFHSLVLHALSHDVPEGWVGDVPSPTLRYTPGLADSLKGLEGALNRKIGLPGEDELSPRELYILKACDRLEFYLWTREQEALGNQFANESRYEVERYLAQTLDYYSREYRFFEMLKQESVTPRQAGIMAAINEEIRDD